MVLLPFERRLPVTSVRLDLRWGYPRNLGKKEPLGEFLGNWCVKAEVLGQDWFNGRAVTGKRFNGGFFRGKKGVFSKGRKVKVGSIREFFGGKDLIPFPWSYPILNYYIT